MGVQVLHTLILYLALLLSIARGPFETYSSYKPLDITPLCDLLKNYKKIYSNPKEHPKIQKNE